MRVKKPAVRKPAYPCHRQFLAALGIGALAAAARAESPPPPPGIPPPPRPAVEEVRLRGDVAVVPTNALPMVPACTNAPVVVPPSTNKVVEPRILGRMVVPRPPEKKP